MIKLHGIACLYIHVYMKTTTLKLSTIFLTEFQFNQRKYFRGNLGSFDTIYIAFHLSPKYSNSKKNLCKYLKSNTHVFIYSSLKIF